jgi:uncharacterized LabA/DUF88 family protein
MIISGVTMAFYPNERIAIFIDGSNLYNTVKYLDFDIDYTKLLEFFSEKGNLITANYYTAIVQDDDYSPIKTLVDWLSYNGWQLITKPAKHLIDRNGRRRVKGDMDAEIIVDMLELCSRIDHMVLFSGDGDFRVALKGCSKERGKSNSCINIKIQPSNACR